MSALDDEFAAIFDGKTTPGETKEFLTRSVAFMGDPDALVAGARAMRERMVRVNAPEGAIDVCGTGGDGAHTLNISTAVAFVVAGAGVPVAKHGNRAMSSKTGAADVLEALGVKLTGDAPTLERCLRDANIAFLFAQNHHPSMRFVAPARRELGFRTIFNLLGPLTNPAGVKRQLVGVFAPDWAEAMAEALKRLGSKRVWVVHGEGGLDELAHANGNLVIALDKGKISRIAVDLVGDEGAGNPEALRGGEAAFNAAALRALLENRSDNEAYRNAVELNAAAALVVADVASEIGEGALIARESLSEGEALARLNQLIALTSAAP